MNSIKYMIAVPTYNGGELWNEVAKNLFEEKLETAKVQVIDSSSNDATVQIAKGYDFSVHVIDTNDFNHGGTRNLAYEIQKKDYDIVIFLTQDAIPQKGCIENILTAFENPLVDCAYGKQLPHDNANPLARHARFFNYKSVSYTVGKEDIPKLGLKTAFMSNSFSAYRIKTLKDLGGFPSNTILCEDMYITAKIILSGGKVSYISDACVKHSHNYKAIEELKRYFDIGVFHCDEPWIKGNFGSAGGEGMKFLKSEIVFVKKFGLKYILLSLINSSAKIIGYKLGLNYKLLPKYLIKKISMHRRYWNEN